MNPDFRQMYRAITLMGYLSNGKTLGTRDSEHQAVPLCLHLAVHPWASHRICVTWEV